jgi:microsomal epoxide hydrolase
MRIKGMKLTGPERIEARQLIPGVRQTWRRGGGAMSVTATIVVVGIISAGAQTPVFQADSLGLRDGWFRTSDGVRLHYLEGGSGRTIVFVPGWTMPGEIWAPQLRHFSQSRRVVALDPRSQGQSETPSEGNFVERRAFDIRELLDHLGDESPVLVGWSLGAHEILQLVEQTGTQRLGGLVLVDDFVWTTPESGRASIFESGLDRLLRDRQRFTAEFVRGMYRRPQDAGYLQRIINASLLTPTPTAYTLLASAYVLGRRDWRPTLRRVDRPLLYIGSVATREDADEVRHSVRQAQAHTLADVGHAVFVDDPVGFNQLLETFLRSIEETQK